MTFLTLTPVTKAHDENPRGPSQKAAAYSVQMRDHRGQGLLAVRRQHQGKTEGKPGSGPTPRILSAAEE